MNRRLIQIVQNALQADNTIAVSESALQTTQGFSEQHMLNVGLSRSDLKKLERKGLAIRGYTKNVWVEGDTLPSGKEVQKGQLYRGKGHRVRWVLVGKGDK